MSILPIPQTHARAVAVLVDEDDAGRFKASSENVQRCVLGSGPAALKVTDRRIADFGLNGKLLL